MELEKTDILERTIPPLAKLFGIAKERAWEILNNNNDFLKSRLEQLETASYRHQVNGWWKQYRSSLSASLGKCSSVSSAGKLPEPTYKQIMCLAWLTEKLKTKEFIQKQKERYEKEVEPRLTLWQRFLRLIKSVFKK